MNRISKLVIGLLIAAVGVVFALNILDITDINLFFEGWWTFLITIPCAVRFFTSKDKTASLIGVAAGIALFLSVRDIIDFEIVAKLFVPAVIIIIGLRIAFGDFFSKNGREVTEKINANEKVLRKFNAVLTSSTINLTGQKFDGAVLTSAFGSLDFDITNSIITEDVAIRTTCLFGSVNIKVPEGVNVKMTANTVFGDTTNMKSGEYPGAPTVYVKCVCVFGGIELR